MGAAKFLGDVALDRAKGRRSSPFKALIASSLAGVAAAGLTYRVLRK